MSCLRNCITSFYPIYETCTKCDGNKIFVNTREKTLKCCSACNGTGTLPTYYPKRSWLSRMILCCKKYDEPTLDMLL